MKLRYVLLSALCVMAIGCGRATIPLPDDAPPLVPARGQVLYNGEPLGGAQVLFICAEGKYPGTATTDAQGNFSVSAFPTHSGVPVGKYEVMVKKVIQVPSTNDTPDHPTSNIESLINEKYSRTSTSGLEADVPEGGTTDLRFELTGN